jgi:galactokinase
MVPTVARVESSGMREDAAASKAALLALASRALPPAAGAARQAAFFVPGRIEVLGKHTDYAGGRSLLCAAEQGFCLVARRRPDRRVCVVNAAAGERAEWALDPDVRPLVGDWTNYPATVVRRVARNFPGLTAGADIAFASDLPPASGMSSSSAFMIAVFLALADANDLSSSPLYRSVITSPESLAAYLATIENGRSFGPLAGDRGVGTFGGSEDHTAILCCKPSTLSQYRFGPVNFERDVPMPAGHVFVIAFSGVLAEKTAAAMATYNRASLAAARVLEIWQRASDRPVSTLEHAVAGGPDVADEIRRAVIAARDQEFGTDLLLKRFDQFVLESRRIVPDAGDALEANDLARFGELVDRSQEATEQWLANHVPETVALAREARRIGALAASAFGAGFGGSVWALVAESEARRFAGEWQDAYRSKFPGAAARARFFETCAGPSAMRLESWGQDSEP